MKRRDVLTGAAASLAAVLPTPVTALRAPASLADDLSFTIAFERASRGNAMMKLTSARDLSGFGIDLPCLAKMLIELAHNQGASVDSDIREEILAFLAKMPDA